MLNRYGHHSIVWKRLIVVLVSVWFSCGLFHNSVAEERGALKSNRVIKADTSVSIVLSRSTKETTLQLEPGALVRITIPELSKGADGRAALLIKSNDSLSFEQYLAVTRLVLDLGLTIAAETPTSSSLASKNNTILLIDRQRRKYELTVEGTLYQILTSSDQGRVITQPVENVSVSSLKEPEKKMRRKIATLSPELVKYVLGGQELPFWVHWDKRSRIVTISRPITKEARALSLEVFEGARRPQRRAKAPDNCSLFRLRILPHASGESRPKIQAQVAQAMNTRPSSARGTATIKPINLPAT